MGRQLVLIDKSGKTHKTNVQDVKIRYPVDELIKYLPDDIALGHAVTYCAHLKHMKDLHWSLYQNVLPNI